MPDPLKVSIVSSHSQFSLLLRPALPTKCLSSVTSLMCPLSAAALKHMSFIHFCGLTHTNQAIKGLSASQFQYCSPSFPQTGQSSPSF